MATLDMLSRQNLLNVLAVCGDHLAIIERCYCNIQAGHQSIQANETSVSSRNSSRTILCILLFLLLFFPSFFVSSFLIRTFNIGTFDGIGIELAFGIDIALCVLFKILRYRSDSKKCSVKNLASEKYINEYKALKNEYETKLNKIVATYNIESSLLSYGAISYIRKQLVSYSSMSLATAISNYKEHQYRQDKLMMQQQIQASIQKMNEDNNYYHEKELYELRKIKEGIYDIDYRLSEGLY